MTHAPQQKCSSWYPRPGCSCHVCQSGTTSGFAAQHPSWRERKQARLHPQAPSNFLYGVRCSCGTCQAAAQAEAEMEALYEHDKSLWYETSSGAKVYFPSGVFLTVTTGNTGTGQEHWDILNSGNPLLDTSGANKDKFLSKNFKVKEFIKSDNQARIDVKLVECLQRLRDALGKPINITSGYRSYGYNKRLYEARGKTPTKSQHISGRAVDINVAGLSGLQLAKEAIKACGCDIAIGLARTYIHLDVRGKYTPNYAFTVWNYASDGSLDAWVTELRQFHRSFCGSR